MSARQQFHFPGASPESPTFSPNLENPLHAASDKSMNESAAASTMRTNTGGLAAVINRQRSHPAPLMGSLPKLARPGTADPYSRNRVSNFAKGPLHVVAPAPQAPRSSPLLSRDSNGSKMNSGFKVPSMVDPSVKSRSSGENNAHISTLDGGSPAQNTGEMFSTPDSNPNANGFMPITNLKFNPMSSNNGARRVSVNGLVNYDDGESYGGASVLPGHEITEDGRVKALNPLKRMHDEVDDDGGNAPYEPPMKRYKNNQNDPANADVRNHMREFSPQAGERPSSGLSHSDHYRSNGSASGDASHFPGQRQRFSGSPSTPHKSTPSPYQPQPIMRRQEPGPLARLLGQDPDVFVQEHMSEYDEMVERWSNCTMQEWIAGADEIMSDYNKILDMVKERVSAKLRLYGTIHENIDKHNALLRGRSEALDATKKKLVNESGSVLKQRGS